MHLNCTVKSSFETIHQEESTLPMVLNSFNFYLRIIESATDLIDLRGKAYDIKPMFTTYFKLCFFDGYANLVYQYNGSQPIVFCTISNSI